MNESFPTGWRISGPPVPPTIASGETASMVLFTGFLLTLPAIWLLVHGQSFTWRATTLAGPALVFLIAGVISTLAASNKHLALVRTGTMISQVALAILLVQWLDAPWKQRLLLCAIAATGVTLAYRCWEQHHYDIRQVIERYQNDPVTILAAQGIEPGTYAAEQFRERLFSRGVGGYFAISNTAASFFIISLMGSLAALTACRPGPPGRYLILGGLILLAQMAGLLLTNSKGGIASMILTLALAGILWPGRRFFQTHWRGTLMAALLLVLLSLAALVGYGLHTERLPGNSLWVRWQYWAATARMIADHGLTGVGGENFSRFYPRYMDPAAPEVISDPHGLPLALWSQWGLLGLLAFIWGTLAAVRRVVRPALATHEAESRTHAQAQPVMPIWLWAAILSFGIMILRWLASDMSALKRPEEKAGVFLIMFIVPMVIWFVSFLIMLAVTSHFAPGGACVLLLGCGVLGFLLHNLIDFSFFQPGVGTLFFAAVALLVAWKQPVHPQHRALGPGCRGLLRLAVILVCGGWWLGVALPVCRSQHHLSQAQTLALRAAAAQNPLGLSAALSWAWKAAAADPLNPDGPALAGQIHYVRWSSRWSQDEELTSALDALQEACRRDPENFQYPRQLREMHEAASLKGSDPSGHREKALEYSRQTLARYPASPELLIIHARLLLQCHQPTDAAACLQKALAFEEDFLAQQRRMFPGRKPLIPRLNPGLRREAETLLQSLNPTPVPP